MKIRNKKQEECKHNWIMGGELDANNRPPLIQSWCDKCGKGEMGLERPWLKPNQFITTCKEKAPHNPVYCGYCVTQPGLTLNQVEEIIKRINNFHNTTLKWYLKSPEIEEYEEEKTTINDK